MCAFQRRAPSGGPRTYSLFSISRHAEWQKTYLVDVGRIGRRYATVRCNAQQLSTSRTRDGRQLHQQLITARDVQAFIRQTTLSDAAAAASARRATAATCRQGADLESGGTPRLQRRTRRRPRVRCAVHRLNGWNNEPHRIRRVF